MRPVTNDFCACATRAAAAELPRYTKKTVDRRVAAPDRLADAGQNRIMCAFDDLAHLGAAHGLTAICRHLWKIHGRIAQGAGFDIMVDHAPFTAFALQRQINHPQMRPEEPAHNCRFARNRAALNIDRGDIRKRARRENLMRVARQNHINPLYPGQGNDRVLHTMRVAQRPNPGMRQQHDQICTGLSHFRHPSANGFDHVAHAQLALKLLAFPCHDLRWGHTQNADAQIMHQPDTVAHLPAQQAVGLDQHPVFARCAADLLGNISRDDRKFRPRQ